MTLITPDYIEQNKALHATGSYGIKGVDFLSAVRQVAKTNEVKSILDYGSGTREWLKGAFGRQWQVQSYDPCVESISGAPDPADLVCAIDVLEHIEPECLDAVLDHITQLAKRLALLTIHTGPARKILPDGRNAHLIQEDERYWLPKLTGRMRLERFQRDFSTLVVLLSRRV